jgi:hypothetical protein
VLRLPRSFVVAATVWQASLRGCDSPPGNSFEFGLAHTSREGPNSRVPSAWENKAIFREAATPTPTPALTLAIGILLAVIGLSLAAFAIYQGQIGYDKIIAAFSSIVIAVFTTLLFLSAEKYATSAKKSADIAEASLVKLQRANVFVADFDWNWHPDTGREGKFWYHFRLY